MSNISNVTLDMKELERLSYYSRRNIVQIVKRFAFRVERGAKKLAAVDTGAMRASIHTRVIDGSGTEQGDVFNLNPNVETVELPDPGEENTIAVVGPTVSYAPNVEFGTSRQAAQPFLFPAVEQERQNWENGEYWKDLVK